VHDLERLFRRHRKRSRPGQRCRTLEFAERVLREATRRVLIGLNGAPLWAKLRHDELDVENIDVIIQALIEHSPDL